MMLRETEGHQEVLFLLPCREAEDREVSDFKIKATRRLEEETARHARALIPKEENVTRSTQGVG